MEIKPILFNTEMVRAILDGMPTLMYGQSSLNDVKIQKECGADEL